jgi:hypothetical protein
VITEQTYYRWRKEFGGLQVNHAQQQGMSERRACQLLNQPRGTQR